jgi:hypothetical protein
MMVGSEAQRRWSWPGAGAHFVGPGRQWGGGEEARVGARSTAIDGAVSIGGEWVKGKRKGKGQDEATAPFRVERRGTGGEPEARGE